MITNTGKEILAKYLIGQAPAYASYMAIGCGAKPVSSLVFAVTHKESDGTTATLTVPGHSFKVGDYVYIKDVDSRINGAKYITATEENKISYLYDGNAITEVMLSPYGSVSYNFADKPSLDFEMFRVPITSRGYVNDNGVSKIVLTAELPTEERYEISEVGIYSAGSNPSAGAYDSRSLYAFTTDENWEHHTPTESVDLPIVYSPLDGDNNDNVIDQPYKVFQTNSDNRLFTSTSRTLRYERARFFNNIVMMRGDSATLSADPSGNLSVVSGSEHIHLTGTNLDFNKNSPVDEIKLAFSLINKDPSSEIIPDEVRILVEFASTDVHNSGEWARFQFIASKDDYDFENNRYIVATKQLQELRKSTGFTWSRVDVAIIYVSILKDDEPSADFYVGLDAVRFENVGTSNPIYGMTGYTVLRNQSAETIIKAANTTNYIEFRFAMDVQ